jgi:hypothetical protein
MTGRASRREASGGNVRGTLAALALLLSTVAPGVHAAVSVYMSPEDLAGRAPLIVEGTVVRTASGWDPERGTLATYVTLELDRVYRGPAELERITLREPGGRFGDLVHDVDAVPRYEVGERVFVFVEPAADGALRTVGMFFGKFRLEGDMPGGVRAVRELDGAGRILGRHSGPRETIDRADLVATTVTVQARPAARDSLRGARRAASRPFDLRGRRSVVPPEHDRLEWDDVRNDGQASPGPRRDQPTGVYARFESTNPDHPSRWAESDSGTPIAVNVDRAGNPLGDGAAAVAQMQRAMDAWTDVPEARITLQLADDDYDYTSSHASGPGANFSGINVILFDDPYDDISDPTNCGGVLAIGGYWRYSSTGDPINNVVFHPSVQLYVVFNNDFECFLGDEDNLAEVAAHELGHGLGFGHSSVWDAIMRPSAYGGRGPRLGDDDMDGAHCHYPHTLTLLEPNGGESWEVGSWQTVRWSSTAEVGPESGTVDLELSTDGGQNWAPLDSDEVNDGEYDWLVPDLQGDDLRLRVLRGLRADAAPSGYPEACSEDGSDASFTIYDAPGLAGSLPAGGPGGGLQVRLEPYGQLRLSWAASCSPEVEDHAVYSGSLETLRAGGWDPSPVTCSAGADLVEYVSPAPGNRFYLVAPLADGNEGLLGHDSNGAQRPPAEASCAPREPDSTCD